MKTTTIERFRAWAVDKADSDVFTSGNHSWTRVEFEVEFLGRKAPKSTKTINTDIKVETYADLEPTQSLGHTEESGE
jgi:hypothetical protein